MGEEGKGVGGWVRERDWREGGRGRKERGGKHKRGGKEGREGIVPPANSSPLESSLNTARTCYSTLWLPTNMLFVQQASPQLL